MNGTVKSYEDLVVWQKSMALVRLVYLITRSFPADEMFGLVSQMRRAAVSVPSNLAEGHARNTRGEFIQFSVDAERSVSELETQLILAIELNFCSSTGSILIQRWIEKVQPLASASRRSLPPRP